MRTPALQQGVEDNPQPAHQIRHLGCNFFGHLLLGACQYVLTPDDMVDKRWDGVWQVSRGGRSQDATQGAQVWRGRHGLSRWMKSDLSRGDDWRLFGMELIMLYGVGNINEVTD